MTFVNTMSMMMQTVVLVLTSIVIHQSTAAFGGDESVLLENVGVLTLYANKHTAARRSSSIPQLKCIGGTAGCSSYTPQVVQCRNQGSDGYDVQWECKTDMDNSFRFGNVEVSCEGYNHPDDPYILKGSCGLEYMLDLTEEGYQQRNKQKGHSYGDSYGSSYYDTGSKHSGSSWMGDMVMLAIVGVIIYAIYRTCITGADHQGNGNDGSTHDTRRRPDPPGFRSGYTPGSGRPGGNGGGGCSASADDTYSGSSSYSSGYSNPGAATGGGGFWTGAATGGLLGYLFGSRTNTYGGYQQRPYGSPFGGGGFGSGYRRSGYSGGGFSMGGGGGGFSSGTRTASGFGGTRRR